MTVNIHLHTTHLQFTGGSEVIPVAGSTVGECLDQLVKQFPGMERELFSGKNKLLKSVEVLVNQTSAFPEELGKSVQDGDDIHILVMLSGG